MIGMRVAINGAGGVGSMAAWRPGQGRRASHCSRTVSQGYARSFSDQATSAARPTAQLAAGAPELPARDRKMRGDLFEFPPRSSFQLMRDNSLTVSSNSKSKNQNNSDIRHPMNTYISASKGFVRPADALGKQRWMNGAALYKLSLTRSF